MTKPSILIVEDDFDCRTVLSELLEMSGYRVEGCSGAREALAAVEARTPSLALVDFMLPDADGGWFVRAVRERGGAFSSLPIILTTGSGDGRNVADQLGVPSIEKPYDVQRLLDLIQTLVPPVRQ